MNSCLTSVEVEALGLANCGNKIPRVLIYGSSGHAKAVIDVVKSSGLYDIVGLLDDFRNKGEITHGHIILGNKTDLTDLIRKHDIKGIFIGIGDNFQRSLIYKRISNIAPQLIFYKAMHADSTVDSDVHIGEGTIIMPGVRIGGGSKIGKFCLLNTNSLLSHDSNMDDFSSLAPGVNTGGSCMIGNHTAVCIGATISHNINIGDHCVIGAGSVVLHDVPSFMLVHGAPARIKRNRKEGDRYL